MKKTKWYRATVQTDCVNLELSHDGGATWEIQTSWALHNVANYQGRLIPLVDVSILTSIQTLQNVYGYKCHW